MFLVSLVLIPSTGIIFSIGSAMGRNDVGCFYQDLETVCINNLPEIYVFVSTRHCLCVFVSCCRHEGLGGGHVSRPLQQCVCVVDVQAWEVDMSCSHYNNVSVCLCRVVDVKACEVDTCRGHYNSVFVL